MEAKGRQWRGLQLRNTYGVADKRRVAAKNKPELKKCLNCSSEVDTYPYRHSKIITPRLHQSQEKE
jgi:hypothetical protein